MERGPRGLNDKTKFPSLVENRALKVRPPVCSIVWLVGVEQTAPEMERQGQQGGAGSGFSVSDSGGRLQQEAR